MTPVYNSGEPADVLERVERTVDSFPRARVVERASNYLHAEFTTALLRFVDDVEFLVEPDETRTGTWIHFRSASRVGYSDLGVNRKRMRAFFQRFARDEFAIPKTPATTAPGQSPSMSR